MKTAPWLGLQEPLVPPQSWAPQLTPPPTSREFPLLSGGSATECEALHDSPLPPSGHFSPAGSAGDFVENGQTQQSREKGIRPSARQCSEQNPTTVKVKAYLQLFRPSRSILSLCGGRAWSEDSRSLYRVHFREPFHSMVTLVTAAVHLKKVGAGEVAQRFITHTVLEMVLGSTRSSPAL